MHQGKTKNIKIRPSARSDKNWNDKLPFLVIDSSFQKPQKVTVKQVLQKPEIEAAYHKNIIPPILHFVWVSTTIGFNSSSSISNLPPENILQNMKDWQAAHDNNWTTMLWNNEMASLHFPKRSALLSQVYNEAWASDLMRLAVLERWGGLYLDADIVPNIHYNSNQFPNRLDPAIENFPKIFLVCMAPRTIATGLDHLGYIGFGRKEAECRTVSNGIIGANPNHPFVSKALAQGIRNSWETIRNHGDFSMNIAGPWMLNDVLYENKKLKVPFLHTNTFLPCNKKRNKGCSGYNYSTIFGIHMEARSWVNKKTPKILNAILNKNS